MVALATFAVDELIIAAGNLQIDMPCPLYGEEWIIKNSFINSIGTNEQHFFISRFGRSHFNMMEDAIKVRRMQAVDRGFDNPIWIIG